MAQWSPKGAPDANGQLLLAARVPRPAPRATRKVERGQLARGKKARGKEGKWKKWKSGMEKKEKRKGRGITESALELAEGAEVACMSVSDHDSVR